MIRTCDNQKRKCRVRQFSPEQATSIVAARGVQHAHGKSMLGVMLLLSALLTGCSALHQPDVRTIEHKMEVLSRIPRSEFKPIDLRLLSQTPPPEHLVDDGDILGIYIEGGPGDEGNQMPVRLPDDRFVMPAIGYPIPVRNGGYIRLPQVGVLHVRGLTVWQIENRIRQILTQEKGQLQDDELSRIHVSLMWRRAVSVMVVRQEEVSATQLMAPTNGTDADRRSGQVVELAAFQNDVLHALMQTGGLPNGQAENAVYVFKRQDRIPAGAAGAAAQAPTATQVAYGSTQHFPQPTAIQLAAFSQVVEDSPRPATGQHKLRSVPERGYSFGQPVAVPQNRASGNMLPPSNLASVLPTVNTTTPMPIDPNSRHPNALRIPLTAAEGEPLMFGRDDVLLEDGDIILVESREQDHFFTGGLLGGGQYALPRNQDLDILDAVLLADSYSRSTQLNSPTRAIGGVSALNRDVTVGASRVIIERTGPDGRKRRFRVSLYAAMKNPDQRVVIEPGDRLYLEYTRAEAFLAFFERHLMDPFLSGGPQLLTD